MRRSRTVATAALLTGLVLGLSACGGGASTAATDSDTPEALQDGVLNVIADGLYPPYEYLEQDGTTWAGMEIELLAALGPKLGVEVQYQQTQFDAALPSVSNGRGDLMIEAMADTEERRRQVDFIDLYRTTLRVMTPAGNPHGIDLGPDPAAPNLFDLCGRTAAVTTGGQQEAFLTDLNQQCVDSGRPAIEALAFQGVNQEYLAVKTSRAEFDLMDPPNAGYFLGQNPDMMALEGSFPIPGADYTGWIVSKSNTDLGDALEGAINELIADGTWTEILGRWGVSESDAVIPPLRNGAASNANG